MELHIVNPDPRYPKADLVAPTRQGYLYIAARVRHGAIPFVLPNARRRRLLKRLKKLAAALEQDVALLKHFWHQLSKKSFRSYVLANLEENHAAAMPVYCRLA